jgi:hypothetical protein
MEDTMKTHNYVQEAWEERFQINDINHSASRFSFGFLLGASITGALFIIGAATAAPLGF